MNAPTPPRPRDFRWRMVQFVSAALSLFAWLEFSFRVRPGEELATWVLLSLAIGVVVTAWRTTAEEPEFGLRAIECALKLLPVALLFVWHVLSIISRAC